MIRLIFLVQSSYVTFRLITYILQQGILDLTNPVLAGHSFGAATTLRTLAEDKRFK